MPTIYIIRGLQGSGKNTLGEHLVGHKNVVSNDDYFVDGYGRYRWDPQGIENAAQACRKAAIWLLREGHNVAVCNTFAREWEFFPYYEVVKEMRTELEIPVSLIIISLFDGGCTDEELFERCTHNVPLDVIRKKRINYQHTLTPWSWL